jgi:hypothetical protein
MKKILGMGLAGMVAVLLATAGAAEAFTFEKIIGAEYHIEGIAKTKIMATKEYMGQSSNEGYLVFLPDVIQGVSEMSPDFAASFQFKVTTNYYCKIISASKNQVWDKDKNTLTDEDTMISCTDVIGNAGTFIDANNCKMVLKFSDEENFSGKLKCIDEDMLGGMGVKYVGKFTGTQTGIYPLYLMSQSEE